MESALPASVSDVEIGLRPENIRIVDADTSESHLTGTVNDLEPLGMHTTVGVDLGGVNFFFTVPGVQEFSDGDKIEMHVDVESIIFFDPSTGKRIS